jgi:hypothetical protein
MMVGNRGGDPTRIVPGSGNAYLLLRANAGQHHSSFDWGDL